MYYNWQVLCDDDYIKITIRGIYARSNMFMRKFNNCSSHIIGDTDSLYLELFITHIALFCRTWSLFVYGNTIFNTLGTLMMFVATLINDC